MAYFVTNSKVVLSTCNKNHHIFKAEFMTYKSFLNIRHFFDSSDGMLNFNLIPEIFLFSCFYSDIRSFPLSSF